jgi:RNA polymerase sigma-70 factor (ECF subfamily)
MENDIRRQLDDRCYSGAFDLLVAEFKDKVFRLAFSMLRNEAQAEDAAQDVFLKVWKALPAFRQGGASLSSWVYAITRNTCLTELKKRSSRPTVSLHDPQMEQAADAIPSLQVSDPESGMEMDVQTMLAQLPEKYRQVITLFYLEQKAYEETAAMLGIPLGTVKTLLFRAKKELLRISSRPPPAVLPVRDPPASKPVPALPGTGATASAHIFPLPIPAQG